MKLKQVISFSLMSLFIFTAALSQEASPTDEEKIADAMGAGPLAISQEATIMDWPNEPGGDYRVLKEGSNGWVCFTSSPRAVEAGLHDSFCDDEMWQEWGAALGEGRDPVIERVGLSYMLLGDAGLSNTDPFATEPTEDNDWHVNGPHLMILLPDASLYEHFSTDPHNGGPFIMFPNTPYAHIMVPVDVPGERQPMSSMTDEEKIADAMSAAPAAIAEDATILDWPGGEGEDFRVLKEGTNGWVCLPSSASAVAAGERSAICDDEVWQAWGAAFSAGEAPQLERAGISYSLSYHHEMSNTDASATGPTEDNDWHLVGPHVAVVVPDVSHYEGLPTDPHNGGPYVMFPNTPYAHIMMPVAPPAQE